MHEYVRIEFNGLNNELKEIIIAFLAEINFEGFEEEDQVLKAYILSDLYDEVLLTAITKKFDLTFHATAVEARNWNKEWESNFNPIVIRHPSKGNPVVAVRADFHAPIPATEYDIIITPKMSFGTGHHATTAMMIKMMMEMNFDGKEVLDFGTGTGILAILAEKFGASKITAIDNDDQSLGNATENFQSNNCVKISLIRASSAEIDLKFDIILANISLRVILDNLQAFARELRPGGWILVSGLLAEHEKIILEPAEQMHLFVDKKVVDNGWICLQMSAEQIVPVN